MHSFLPGDHFVGPPIGHDAEVGPKHAFEYLLPLIPWLRLSLNFPICGEQLI